MKTALLQLLEDFLSAFVFIGFYLAVGNLPLAVAAALAVGRGSVRISEMAAAAHRNDAVAQFRACGRARRGSPAH